MAPIFTPDLIHELIEAGRFRQVHVGIRLQAMPVTARDQQLVPFSRKPLHQSIFFPVAKTIQLYGVDHAAVLGEELFHPLLMQALTDLVQIP